MAEIRTLPEKLIDEIAVSIDGQQFFVRNPDAISALDHMYIQRSIQRIGTLLDQDANSDDEKAEVSRMLTRICLAVVDAPVEEQAKLTDQQRLKIMDFFLPRLQQPPQGQKTQAPGMRKRKKSNGTKSSRV